MRASVMAGYCVASLLFAACGQPSEPSLQPDATGETHSTPAPASDDHNDALGDPEPVEAGAYSEPDDARAEPSRPGLPPDPDTHATTPSVAGEPEPGPKLALGPSRLANSLAAQNDTGDGPRPKGPEDGIPDPSPGAGTGRHGEGVSYEEYTWYDGDDERTVRLISQPQASGTSDTRGAPAAGQSSPGGVPTFLSESGSELSLPGGVILVLDPGWSAGEVDAFLAGNGIQRSRASELGWIGNGFLIEAGPGLESLELANSLAVQHGVVISSPNWAIDPIAY